MVIPRQRRLSYPSLTTRFMPARSLSRFASQIQLVVHHWVRRARLLLWLLTTSSLSRRSCRVSPLRRKLGSFSNLISRQGALFGRIPRQLIRRSVAAPFGALL